MRTNSKIISKLMMLIMTILIASTFSTFAQSFIFYGGENGQYWKQGTYQTIYWDKSEFNSKVNILLWDGSRSKFITIVNNYSSHLGKYNWYIPEDLSPGRTFKIKIESSESPNMFIISENFLEIYPYQKQDENNKLSVDSKIVKHEITIYPNPAYNKIFIKNADLYSKYQIINNLGEVVKKGAGINDWIDVSDLPAGMYVVRIFINRKKEYKSIKFIKY